MVRCLSVLGAFCLGTGVSGNVFHRMMQEANERHARQLQAAQTGAPATTTASPPKPTTTISADSDPLLKLFGATIKDSLDSDPIMQMAERLKSGDHMSLLKEMSDNPSLNELFKDAAMAHELVNTQSYLKMVPGVKKFGNRRLADVGGDDVSDILPCPPTHLLYYLLPKECLHWSLVHPKLLKLTWPPNRPVLTPCDTSHHRRPALTSPLHLTPRPLHACRHANRAWTRLAPSARTRTL